MAFSMFLRGSGCSGRVLTQQLMKLSTQAPLTRHVFSQTTPLATSTLRNIETPLKNAVRSFKTSPVHRSSSGNHAQLWVVERFTALALLAVIPPALVMPNKVLDSAIAILMTAHTFWGFEAIAVDYVRASIFGPMIPKIAIGLVYALCIATLGGLFYVISHDIGIANSIRQFWAIKAEKKA